MTPPFMNAWLFHMRFAICHLTVCSSRKRVWTREILVILETLIKFSAAWCAEWVRSSQAKGSDRDEGKASINPSKETEVDRVYLDDVDQFSEREIDLASTSGSNNRCGGVCD